MSEEKKIIHKEELNHCVVHDDTHGWGGSDNPEDIIKDSDELINKLIKKFPEIHIDEPMNWPYR